MNYDYLVQRLEDRASDYNDNQTLFDEAAAAIQELQRDAMRFRWLRDNPCEYGIFGFHFLCYEKLDVAIDEAMQKEQP